MTVPKVGAYVETGHSYASRKGLRTRLRRIRGWVESVTEAPYLGGFVVLIRCQSDGHVRPVIVSPDRPDPFVPGNYDLTGP